MRTRTKMNGLVYHAKPSGKTYQSGQNRCLKKLQKLEALIKEGYKLTDAKKVREEAKPKAVITIVFGKETKVDIQVFKTKYEPLGFKIVAEV